MPPRTRSGALRARRSLPANVISPRVTSPRSGLSNPLIDLSVVLLPAPFAPRRATRPPSGTSIEMLLTARNTRSYTTSILLRLSSTSRARSFAGLLELFRVLLDFGPDQILVGAEPVGLRHEFAAVPAGDASLAAALVILPGHRDTGQESIGGEIADRLDAIVQPRPRYRTVRRLFGRLAHTLGDDRRHHHTDVVV